MTEPTTMTVTVTTGPPVEAWPHFWYTDLGAFTGTTILILLGLLVVLGCWKIGSKLW